MNADDIEQVLQDIPVHLPAVVPVRTVQEAVAAGDLPPLDVDATNVFSISENILQDHHHPGKQPGPQPLQQRTASDILLHSV
jgi:hypothetical protein